MLLVLVGMCMWLPVAASSTSVVRVCCVVFSGPGNGWPDEASSSAAAAEELGCPGPGKARDLHCLSDQVDETDGGDAEAEKSFWAAALKKKKKKEAKQKDHQSIA